MSWLYYIILFFLILLIIPLPIKFGFKYEKLCITLYIYKFKININKVFNFFNKKKKKKPCEEKEKGKSQLDFQSVLALINYVDQIRFKPTLRFKFYCSFGLIDASKTAITYGYVNSFSPVLYKFLTIPFKIKKYTFHIEPDFDETMLETNMSSIIFVNIIKIIYMSVLILNKYKKIQKLHANT